MGDASRRHKRAYSFFSWLVPPFIMPMFRLESEPAPKVEGAYVVVSNHNTNLDPVIIAMSFRYRQMYFVASEHVYRAGFASFLLKRYFAPISRMKGGTDASTAMNTIRTLRKGNSVCIFAEGNRSFNGETCEIHPATAKLVKSAGVSLVTYKFTGGYLTTPRWSFTRRKGRMHGAVVSVYSPEQIKRLSADEIHEIIKADLYENAYERQKREHIPFKGKKLAEGLETALYICPNCGKIGTLHSDGDRFYCDACDMEVVYNEYGELVGNAPFTSVLEWDNFQKKSLAEKAANREKLFFLDENCRLNEIGAKHKARTVDKGTLSMNCEVLSCGGTEFRIDDISDINIVLHNTLMFTANDIHYELRTEKKACARKYVELYKIIGNK